MGNPPSGPVAPLTHAQARLWFMQHRDPLAAVYNEGALWDIEGPLDVDALAAALDAATARQPMLRTRFLLADGAPVQCVDGPARAPLERIDLAGRGDGSDVALLAAAREFVGRPYDLAATPPVRWALFQRGSGRYALLRGWHHIVGDGLSQRGVNNDIAAAYALARAGASAILPPLARDYHDYARRLANEQATPAAAHALESCRARLAGAPALALATDFRRPDVQSFRGDRVQVRLAAAARDALVSAAREQGAGPGTAFLAAWAILLARLSGEPEVVVGLGATPSLDSDWSDVLGLFVNLVPARIDLGGVRSAAEALRHVHEAAVTAMGAQAVPFDRLVDALGLPRVASHNPLCQVAFVRRPARVDVLALAGCAVSRLPFHAGQARFDFQLSITDGDGGADAAFDFATDLYERATVERMARQYAILVDAIARTPHAPIAALPLMDDASRRAILRSASGVARPPAETTVGAAFARQAAATPVAPAVETLDYRALWLAACALAAALRDVGVGPGARVAVCCERVDERIVGWLAVLEAGAAYVPLDGEVPDMRLATMLEDAGVRHAIADAGSASRFERLGVAVIGSALRGEDARETCAITTERAGPRDPACVFFTSGSTGRPKGVVVPHAAIVHLARGSDYAAIGADDVVALLASPAFDASTFEVWGALLNGARLAPIPRSTVLAAREFAGAIARERVTALFVTTALFESVAREAPAAFAGVRTVLFGGETCDPRRVAQVLRAGPPQRLVHVYGPTETTTFATWYAVERVHECASAVSIGRALAGVEVHVLRDDDEPAAAGETGEIVIGGCGVATGYLESPSGGDQRFVELALGDGPPRRFYRSGDRGLRRDDGTLVFVGRRDGQVKIRGHRIELGEVEAALASLPGVAAAAAVLGGDTSDTRRIAAYLVAADPHAPPPADVRRMLRARLPATMLPAEIVWLPALPLNANGKVDRRALPSLASTPLARVDTYVAPRDPLEADIVRRWEALLGRRGLGLRDRFFDAGGHSLLAARFATEYERDTGFAFPLIAFFVDDSVEGVAQAIRSQAFRANSAITELHAGGARMPLVYVHGDFMAGGFHGHALARWLGADQPLLLVHPHGIADRSLPTTIEAMAEARMRALRELRPHGPYVVGGHCNGAFVALELARKLNAAGEIVAAVVIVDAWVPGSRERTEQEAIREVLAAADARTWTDRMRELAVRLYCAMLAYRPAVFDGHLVVLRSEDGPAAGQDPAWALLAASVELHVLTGNHTSLVLEENAGSFAQRLRGIVAQAERRVAAPDADGGHGARGAVGP